MTNDLNGNKYKLSICKCSECNDGYLIVKKTDNPHFDRMLGCTNYNSRHCTNYMFPYNYTQDKNKILKTEDGKVYNNEFKSEVLIILNDIKSIYLKYPKFRFGYNPLRDFLTGKESKTITAFKLDENDSYGIYSAKPAYYVVKFLGALLDFEILNRVKDDKGHENLDLVNSEPDDDTIIEIYNALKWK